MIQQVSFLFHGNYDFSRLKQDKTRLIFFGARSCDVSVRLS